MAKGEVGADHGSRPAHRVAVVTGGSRGIGAAVAAAWAESGGCVVVADVDEAAGLALVEQLAGAAEFVRCDITDEAAVADALDLAVQRWGRVDSVFANAGAVGVTGRIEDTSLSDFTTTLDLLLTGAFLTVKHAVRVMRPQGAGAIVCTASVASIRGGLGPHAYTAAKHAVKGLVESVAAEIGHHGLTINAVAPGATVSSLSAGLMSGDPDDLATAYERLAAATSSGVPVTARDVADSAIFLARSPRINGACLVIDGGDYVLGAQGRQFYAG